MKNIIVEEIKKALFHLGITKDVVFTVETPPQKEYGDYSTNIALVCRDLEGSPAERAEKIKEILAESDKFEWIKIAGPGFINIKFSQNIYQAELIKIFAEGKKYGQNTSMLKECVNVEFVSANPTGPLHVGNARGGPIGESIARIYEACGADVTREFYVNDIGGQVNRFGESLYYWFAKKEDPHVVFPEGGYPGEYIEEISEKIQQEKEDKLSLLKEKDEMVKFFKEEGLAAIVAEIKKDCQLIDINFDNWVYQSKFEDSGKSDMVVSTLEQKGATAKKEGALWFKSPANLDLDDKESVLRKSADSTLTYFADDIAYHIDKLERGYGTLIDVWGANHHGHIARLKSALTALDYPAEKLEIVLYQYIRLKQGDEAVKMGKRFGNFVTLRQVIESGVEPDAFKYFILSQNSNTPFDFNLELAADKSDKNPVYYIKYAHARICSILAKAGESESAIADIDLAMLTSEYETDLYRELVKFPEIILEAKSDFSVQLLPHFAYKIATLFHNFYANCQVIDEDKKMQAARIALISAAKTVIANCLNLSGIEAPEHM